MRVLAVREFLPDGQIVDDGWVLTIGSVVRWHLEKQMDEGPSILFGVIGYEQPTACDCECVANSTIHDGCSGMPGAVDWWGTVQLLMLHGY